MAVLDDVKENLPAGLDDWTDEYISGLIASGITKNRILNRAWLAKASSASEMVDISESGSSRNISSIYKNAMDMAEYWGRLADKEEDNGSAGGKARSRTHRAVRV